MNQRLLLAVLTGCTTDIPERGGPIVRDWAGVKIIEHPADYSAPTWLPARQRVDVQTSDSAIVALAAFIAGAAERVSNVWPGF